MRSTDPQADGAVPASAGLSQCIEPERPLPLPEPIALGEAVDGAPYQWTGMNREQLLRNVRRAHLFQPTPEADADFERWIREDIAERFGKPTAPGQDLRVDHPPAVDDAKAAMRWLRGHAVEHDLDPAQIGFISFSAGAHSGHRLAEQATADEMPAHLALIYGGLQATRPRAPVPPLFVAQAADDPLFPVTHIDLPSISPLAAWLHARYLHLPPFVTLGPTITLGDSALTHLTLSGQNAPLQRVPARTVLAPSAAARDGDAPRELDLCGQIDVQIVYADLLARLRLHAMKNST